MPFLLLAGQRGNAATRQKKDQEFVFELGNRNTWSFRKILSQQDPNPSSENGRTWDMKWGVWGEEGGSSGVA